MINVVEICISVVKRYCAWSKLSASFSKVENRLNGKINQCGAARSANLHSGQFEVFGENAPRKRFEQGESKRAWDQP